MGLPQQLANRSFAQRLRWVRFLLLLGVVGVLARALYLQVYLKDDLERRALRQYNQAKEVELQRGTISDATGALLAVSLPMQSLFAVPSEVENPQAEAQKLAPYLGQEEGALAAKLSESTSFTWLKRQAHPLIAQKVESLALPGVHSLAEYRRFYPFQTQGAQLLGFVGMDSKGLEGLEFRYNDQLMDRRDQEESWSNFLSGTPMDRLSGGSMQLSLDSRLQHYVESELVKGVSALGASDGVAILMESATGRILAMASAPSFDPNRYKDFERSYYFNRAVGVAYEPGSTFKMITLATALENKVVAPDDFFFCENGSYRIQDRLIHDVKPYGWLSLDRIIQKSSNICAAKIGLLIPRETFYKSIESFGFGKKTRLNLPAEAAGKLYPTEEWTPVKVATMSYGHAISVTPVQMTAAINTIANGGVYVEPRVVDSVKTAGGEEVELPPSQSHKVISPETVRLLTGYMFAVTQDGGTGRMAQVSGLDIAGKSGTSRKFNAKEGEYSSSQHISSFIGFFPAQKPWVTLFVMVDEPNQYYLGSKSAVPIFHEIATKVKDLNPALAAHFDAPTLALDRAQPVKPDSQPVLDKNRTWAQVQKLLLKKSLREALFLAGREGIKVRVQGTGLVRDLRADPKQPGGYVLYLSL
ncbi:MAG: hypothetical protein A2600_13490 [Candidatus Lambdaproteobacteria bacterium RIFOXYD1_FULL_56_27]|uniref:PASTA domain-containing protein n=1 Tax=Candidatus Lambdaproteobacteria bacterium RIFOXYD2_FULL_56_26 TaxID=1817773 RepID=A0A1F6GP63_9PROT|nr:MAG: hypothetical protein A2557_11630 [Candidatus Lambdaproteobacteria bacterium RIFOXYD2_FULL_56_26]OGH03881.1 MAG: hypothetical protein A2426_09125 [Candidatus Lambdaproteobacteria bacterium RIFOXYC1_FULL_56_13]OGH08927.1 MAG: hypothetical protein A2600_13490 [Candidatus Lambdaproteobacteria bacterium RIFOXYD1_FULL_56_27]